uniref:NADH-ubiquinone oxidoreductase chain 2 n=1 Tax=Prosevania sp. ZJUH_2016031 TaxID=2491170 RepID=A0A3S8V1C1_9HYME|nr:NADH dehydrogenase subunit 2 [Prosevania sp. ZJUH_2016031]
MMYISEINYNSIITPLLIFISMISLTSNSLLFNWIILEINLMLFLSNLILDNCSFFYSFSSSLIYFIVQSFSSSILLTSLILNMLNLNYKMNLINIMFLISLMIKINMFPFHMWMMKLCVMINWIQFWILSTIQKIIPLMMLSNLNFKLIMLVSLINMIGGGILGLNKILLMKIFTSSSIYHLGCLLLLIKMMKLFWFIYFLIYSTLMLTLSLKFNKFNIKNTMQMFSNKNTLIKFIILSIAGLPPLWGIMIKWLSMQTLMYFINMMMMMLIFMISSLLNFFFYLKLILNSSTMNSNQKKINQKYSFIKFMMIILLINPLSLNMYY